MKHRQDRILTIPNLISLFRLLLIPAIAWLYIARRQSHAAFFLLLISWLSDILDGWIARRFQMTSRLGVVLDPAADKLTLVTVLFCMVFTVRDMLPLLVVLVLVEGTKGVFGLVRMKNQRHIAGAKWHGKVATGCLYTTILLHMAWESIPHWFSQLTVYVSLAVVVVSMTLYCLYYARALRRPEGEGEKE